MIIRDQIVMVMSGLGFQVGELADEVTLQNLGIDSTELIEILVALENHFSISIDSETLGAFTSVGDLISRVSDLLTINAAMKG